MLGRPEYMAQLSHELCTMHMLVSCLHEGTRVQRGTKEHAPLLPDLRRGAHIWLLAWCTEMVL